MSSLITDALLSGVIGGTTASIMSVIKIPKLNSGKGNFSAVEKQLLTKLSRGVITKISLKSLGKFIVVELFNAFL